MSNNQDSKRNIFSLHDEYDNWRWGKVTAVIVLIAILAVTLVVLAFTSLYSVEVGYAGMKVNPLSKSISDPITGPVWGLKWPWEDVIKIPYARESLGMWGDGTDEYADFPMVDGCFSDEGSELTVDIMIRWQLDLHKLKDLYQSYPSLNWEDRAVASVSRESVRFVIGEYPVMHIVENREIVILEIEKTLNEKLSAEASLFDALQNIEVDVRKIGIPEKLSDAIDDKLAAEQAKMEAAFLAEKRIILEEAEAKALLISANATAQQKIIDANGIRTAIDNLVAEHTVADADYMDFLQLYAYLKTLETLSDKEGVNFIVGIDEGNIFISPQP